MESNAQESVTQSDVNSVQVENQTEIKSNPIDDYKKDMFRYKSEAKALKEKLAEYEMNEQQRKGNLESVITKLKDDLQAEKSRNLKIQSTFAEQRLNDEIKATALEKGLKGTQLDAFLKLIDNESKQVVEFDERFNVRKDDVTNLVDDHLKRYGEIFARKVTVADAVPNKAVNTSQTNKFDVNKASVQDIIGYLKENKDKLK